MLLLWTPRQYTSWIGTTKSSRRNEVPPMVSEETRQKMAEKGGQVEKWQKMAEKGVKVKNGREGLHWFPRAFLVNPILLLKSHENDPFVIFPFIINE